MQTEQADDPSPAIPAALPASGTESRPGAADQSSKACDSCRVKKIRCDRKTPCSSCRQRDTLCTKSPRVQRPKRQQDPSSAEYVHKIQHLERQLRLVRSARSPRVRATDEVPHRLVNSDMGASPNSASDSVDAHSPSTLHSSVAPGTCPSRLSYPSSSETQHSQRGPTEQTDEGAVLLEGPTSLSAHSARAINFLDERAGTDEQGTYSMETKELVESLRRIVKAIKTQSAPQRDVSASIRLRQEPEGCGMPPIQASVAAIRQAQERRDVTFQFLDTLLPTVSISDICLRVYFADDYSDADFIIINAALYYSFDELITRQQDALSPTNPGEYKSMCQRNLDLAISRLPLHLPHSHEMILALILGAIYSVEMLKPHWAWTLVTSAYQASYALGYHLKRPSGAQGWCGTSNPSGLMFWVIYFLEKTLCLRLGRCSTIPDGEITVMLPGGSPGLEYSRSMVKLAQLAGKLYEKLYGPQALVAFREQGRLPVEELSQELKDISVRSQEAIQAWRCSSTTVEWRTMIEFLSASDKVLHHCMQTMILSTVSAHGSSSKSFTEECVASAREALAAHQECPMVLAGVQSGSLTSYLSWIIFFRPFVPFIVLFCHVLETGHRGDLQRMRQFADSMRSLRPGGPEAAMRHRRLFQVFHDVALRYVEMKTASAGSTYDEEGIQRSAGSVAGGEGVSEPGGDGVSHEIDNCLSVMGFSSYLPMGDATAADPLSSSADVMAPLAQESDEFHLGGPGSGMTTPHLPHWFRKSQQMMGLMDYDQISF